MKIVLYDSDKKSNRSSTRKPTTKKPIPQKPNTKKPVPKKPNKRGGK